MEKPAESCFITRIKAVEKVVGCFTYSIRQDWSGDVTWRNKIIKKLHGSCIEEAVEDGRYYRDSNYPYGGITEEDYFIIMSNFPDLYNDLKLLISPHLEDYYNILIK